MVTALTWGRPVLAIDELTQHGQKLHWLESDGMTTWLASWNETDDISGFTVPAGSAAHSYGGGVYALLANTSVVVEAGSGQLWDVDQQAQLTSIPGQFGGLHASGPVHVVAVVDSGDSTAWTQ